MTTTIKNTRGSTVLEIDDRTADVTTPLTVVGRNYPGYGSVVFGDMWALMEHFADTTPPDSPVEGMIWFDTNSNKKVQSFYDGSKWVELLGSTNSMSSMLTRLGTADGVDFTSTGSTAVHTVAASTRTMVSGVLLVPASGTSSTGTATFSLEITNGTGDIMDTVIVDGMSDATKFGFFQASGVNRIAVAGDTIKINVTQAASGTLDVDVYLFGYVSGV